MITLPRYLDISKTPVVHFVGLGNAGVNLADRITLEANGSLQIVAMNSDRQSLVSSVASDKIVLGPIATRGLGAGGDPEVGFEAAKESMPEIQAAFTGADIIFLCAGLGGGTASGAGGVVAEIAKQSGALLIAVLTSPFAFEGRRRKSQATAALAEISKHADATIHFENDRIAELSAPRSGVAETFSACDHLLTGCVTALTRLITAPGPLSISLPDLLSVLKGAQMPCLFGTGQATGDNRAHESLEAALKSPLLDRGRLLEEAGSLLVHISGPANLSFAEVGAIMQETARQISDSTMLHFGVSTLEGASPVIVTLLGKCGASATAVEPPVHARDLTPTPVAESILPQKLELPIQEVEEIQISEPLQTEPPIVQNSPKSQPQVKRPTPVKVKQETLQFEPVTRGRFEKIEPTIVEGEDLDIPTFLRRSKR